jgi:3-hydroxybutyryl-CoA dehydratase
VNGSLGERADAVRFTKTLGEADVYLFAGVTGDFAPIHIDAGYAASTPVGERLAHGALLLGLMSAAATLWCREQELYTLSYGYDRLRFIRPVRLGDTITITYAREEERPERRQVVARVEATNQRGEIVGAALHILWRLPDDAEDSEPRKGLRRVASR